VARRLVLPRRSMRRSRGFVRGAVIYICNLCSVGPRWPGSHPNCFGCSVHLVLLKGANILGDKANYGDTNHDREK
jgi:hypothetical protein